MVTSSPSSRLQKPPAVTLKATEAHRKPRFKDAAASRLAVKHLDLHEPTPPINEALNIILVKPLLRLCLGAPPQFPQKHTGMHIQAPNF